jgi:hypothetical protein
MHAANLYMLLQFLAKEICQVIIEPAKDMGHNA